MKLPAATGSHIIYGLTVLAVWFGWEIVKAPAAERGPPALAVRIAPSSPETLRRAAEEQLASGRVDNAKALAEASLSKAPFNARALRVFGLAAARQGEVEQADEILTLAGNWSLRDDPSHAWLIERRLRQGNYGSAFAHADTLARRWVNNNERIYNLFTTAVLTDQRALPALVDAVKRKPPWRSAYIEYLIKRPDGDTVLLALGLALAESPDGYSNQELSWIYQSWYWENRFEAIRALRAGTGRPGRLDDLQNGDFSIPSDETLFPFGWRLDPTPGISTALLEDDVRPDESVLRVEYDGYASGVVTEQILMLPSGMRTLVGKERVESSPATSRLRWRITCVETAQVIGMLAVSAAEPGVAEWRIFRMPLSVPSAGCQVQRLRLETDAGDRRATTIAWFDKLRIATPTSER